MFLGHVAALRYNLSQDEKHNTNHNNQPKHEFDFIDGAVLWPPARGICDVFGEQVDCYSYFDESAASILRAVEDLAVYARTNGPFDGVIGFSQGAVLAATLLIALATANDTTPNQSNLPLALRPLLAKSPFRFAVFLCGGDPFDLAALQRGEVRLVRELPPGHHAWIRLPTVNCWASNDEDYPGMGPSLSALCDNGVNEQVVHTVGHGVPTEGEELHQLVTAVRATMERAQNSELVPA
ncbi:uncharacterized protein BO97DRAFT_402274 [Aspergillus homomorphus CBS 101889]|uniref:Serine hydrolase domain-containing protein n=1 Tax=Aspergillus homomorphus (strain CBS 101889) TaxID=1450537 RepID=A0A395IF09_ASPHC|nr:hypothetical protein BO97DRAFT_402274 [Aspergillus homomorphus CBS 101889]RAL17773.1 hypothetical protein BO97DRAFT_402274 [Aspergillus homomorphus CBS 101889]